jgi:hypothetical protein
MSPILFLFDLGEGVGDPAAHIMNAGFLTFGVLFNQHFRGNFLLWERGKLRWSGDVSQRQLFGNMAHFLLLGMASFIGHNNFGWPPIY